MKSNHGEMKEESNTVPLDTKRKLVIFYGRLGAVAIPFHHPNSLQKQILAPSKSKK